MSNSGPILTIGIPTWNRENELRECLDIVLPQVTAETGVEILVCDNASEDGTSLFVRDLASQYSFLQYERHSKNIGADRNFIEVLKRAAGIYVWILSDDDFLSDGAVRNVVSLIRNHTPSCVTLNYIYCDDKRQILKQQPDQRYMLKQDVAHADINRSFQLRSHWLSFLSCVVYRRDLLNFEDIEASRDKVPNWIQVYMTAQVLANGKDAYHSSFDGVLARAGNDRVDSTPFIAYMPEAFMYIFRKFNVDKAVADSVIHSIKETFLSFPCFLAYRARGLEPSPLIVPAHFKIGLLLPRPLLLGIRKLYRLFLSRHAVRQPG